MKNSDSKIICVIVLLIMQFAKLSSQSLMNLVEVTNGGKVYEIKNIVENGNIKCYPNIDINSTVQITLNPDLIKSEVAKWLNVKTNLPIERMKSISIILQKRADLIDEIKFQSSDIRTERISLKKFANDVLPLLIIVGTLDENNALRIKANKVFSVGEKDASITYINFFNLLQDEINSISDEYKKVVEENKVFFRLGAFVNHTPVHLEGFDSFKEGEYLFVQPFITSISEDEKKEFEKYKELAKDANDNVYKAFKDKVKEVMLPLFDSLKQAVKIKFSSSINSFESANAIALEINNEIRNEIGNSKNEISRFIGAVDLLIAAANDVENEDYINNILTNIQNTSMNFINLKTYLNNSLNKLYTLISVKGKTAADSLKKGYEEGKNVIDEIVNDAKVFLDSKLQLNISFSEKLTESFLKLGDEVNKIPLENIPTETTLDLRYTGNRKNGDRLYLKAVIDRNLPSNKTVEEKTIDFTSVGLYQIRLHNSINPVFLMVDNTSAQFTSKKQFQFDPSYSVLFKKGSRKNTFYNDFVELGLGINVATLDFNNDNNPEIGIGVVASFFKDYVQIGYGRNIGVDQNYWFFGLRLPFLGFNFNGTTKTYQEDK
jgi:hypothetical protein